MSQILMSIDSGGSKTICLLQTPKGELLGWGRGGPTLNLPTEEAVHSFEQALTTAMDSCGISGAQISLVFYSQLGQFEALQLALGRKQVKADGTHLDDPLVALFGALCSDWGVVALSGTGSFVYARNRKGESKLIGGLGNLLGDDGSGYEIGLNGLRAAFRYVEGWEEETLLADEICREWGIDGFRSDAPFLNPVTRTMSEKVYRYMPDNYRCMIAKLNRVVARCAQKGDRVSQNIIQQAGMKLAYQVVALCDQIDMGSEPIPIGYAGGCWRIGDLLINAFQDTLRIRMKKSYSVIPQKLEPVFGVYLAALDRLNVPWSGELLTKLNRYNDDVKKEIST